MTRPRSITNPLDPRNPLAGIYLSTALFELAEGALRFLVPLNLDARGQSPQSIGLVVFAFSLSSLLARGVTATLYRPDRARRLIVVAGLASTVAYLLTPFVRETWVFAALMSIDGFGWGVATTSLLAVMMTSTPREISPAVAMGWFIGFQGLAFAVATTVAGLLADRFTIQTAMLILATVPVIAATLVSLRLPPAIRGERVEPLVADPDEAEIRVMTRARRLVAGGFRAVAALPFPVWAAAVTAVYLNVMNGLLSTFFPLLGLALGLSIAQIGMLSSTRSAVSSVARFGAGWLFGHVSAHRLHLPLLAVSAGTLAMLPLIPSYALQFPGFALNGMSRGLLRVTTSAAAMESLDGTRAGLAAAVMTAGLDVGKMIGPLIGGFVAGAFGLGAMFQIVPLVFLALYAVIYVLAPRDRIVALGARRS